MYGTDVMVMVCGC